MTTRTSPGSVSCTTLTKNYRANGTISEGGAGSFTAKWTNTVTYGDNIPGWREALRDGRDATTSLTGSRVVAQFTPGYAFASRPKIGTGTQIYKTEWLGRLGVNFQVPSGDPSNIDETKANSLALGKFGQRIREVNTAFEGGVFLGELAQTLKTIRNPAKGLRNLVDQWRAVAVRIRRSRINPLAARSRAVAEALADSWLEVQYGWKPLLNDIDAGSLALHKYKVGQPLRVKRVTASGSTEAASAPTLATQGSNLLLLRTETSSSNNCTVVYRGAMRVEARDPRTMDPKLIGFDLSNWVPTAWELVPYSFLIDYFSNIGDIINGWSLLGTRLAWCNRTVIKEIRVRGSVWTNLALCRSQFPEVNSVSIAPAKSVFLKRNVSRAKYSGGFTPDFVLEIPAMGSLKWLNIAALVVARREDRKWSYGD